MDQLRELATDYLYGRLSPEEKHAFEQRLDSDLELRRVLEEERELNSMLTLTPGMTARSQAEAAFWREFKAQKASGRGQLLGLSRFAIPAGIAAALVLALLIGFDFGSPAQPNPDDGNQATNDPADPDADDGREISPAVSYPESVSTDELFPNDAAFNEALAIKLIEIAEERGLDRRDFVNPELIDLAEEYQEIADDVFSQGFDVSRRPKAEDDDEPRGPRFHGKNGRHAGEFSLKKFSSDALRDRFEALGKGEKDAIGFIYDQMIELSADSRREALRYLRGKLELDPATKQAHDALQRIKHVPYRLRLAMLGKVHRLAEEYKAAHPEFAGLEPLERKRALGEHIMMEMMKELYAFYLPSVELSEADFAPDALDGTVKRVLDARRDWLRDNLSPDVLTALEGFRQSDPWAFYRMDKSLRMFEVVGDPQERHNPDKIGDFILSWIESYEDWKDKRRGPGPDGWERRGDGERGPDGEGERRRGERPRGGPERGERGPENGSPDRKDGRDRRSRRGE